MAFDVTEHRVVVVMGVAGSGKTTIGRRLAELLAIDFCDADDLHSAANVTKMASGQPLNDADRSSWLSLLRVRVDRALANRSGMVLACSALKRRFRERLGLARPGCVLAYLRTTPELAARRLAARTGHFMPPSLLASQFSDLEEPTDAIVFDADQPVEAIVSQLIAALAIR
jgi:gluconokinase